MTARMARFLTSLYPRQWRKRYVREYRQFLEEQPLTILAILNVVCSAVQQRVRGYHGRGMFELYSDGAKRAIFYARYEASQSRSVDIQPEHMLLGLLRENKAELERFLGGASSVQTILRDARMRLGQAETPARRVSDLSLSAECKRILAYTQEEADQFDHRVGVEHLLLGILRAERRALRKSSIAMACRSRH